MTIIEKKVVMVSVLRFVWKSVLPGHDVIDACGWVWPQKITEIGNNGRCNSHKNLLKYNKVCLSKIL